MNLNVIADDGYLANPYRSIRYLDSSNPKGYSLASQVYPDTRTSTAVQAQAKYYLPYRAAVTGSYRYFSDTWGIVGNTVELDYTHPIRNIWILEGRLRYYKQNSATFYSDLFPFANSQNFEARDQNLAALSNTTIGAKVTYAFLPDGWKIFKRATITGDVSRIDFRYSRFSQHQVLRRAQLPPGHRAALRFQRDGLADLYIDVLLTRSDESPPPYQDHRCEGRNDRECVGNPIPKISVSLHDVEALNELDQGAESRQQRRNRKEIAPRERRRGKPRQGIEGDEMFRFVPRHQLHGKRGGNDGTVESEDQRGEKCDLSQANQRAIL